MGVRAVRVVTAGRVGRQARERALASREVRLCTKEAKQTHSTSRHTPKKGVNAASFAVLAGWSPLGDVPPPTPNSIQ
jgi:hypothetical protein